MHFLLIMVKDIVCAGASAVSFGAINAVHALTGVTPEIEQGEDGFLRCVDSGKSSGRH